MTAEHVTRWCWSGLAGVGLACVLFNDSFAADWAFDPAQAEIIVPRMAQFVDDGVIAGAVTLVGFEGRIEHFSASGFSDLNSQERMLTNHLFWIASMTKPITATAILMLQDEGKLSVDDPVAKHLPEFRNPWLIESRSNERLVLKRPARPVTLRDLLTHTSGLSDVPSPRQDATLGELVMAYSQAPLQFEPGSRWQYSNAGINTLGRVVEVVSGMPFDEFLRSRIFEPLGMPDTTFVPDERQLWRLAKSYRPSESGDALQETGIYFFAGREPLSWRKRTVYPAGGLFSTAADLFRFYQMILDGGVWNGRRIVSEESIRLMTQTRTGELQTGFTEGMSFGLGWAVVKEPSGVTGMLSKGTFGHGGAYGTQGWVDPKKKLILVLMIQRAALPNADASDVRRAFQEIAVSAVREESR